MPSLHILANMHNNRVDITKTIRQICVMEALILSFALACKKKILCLTGHINQPS